MNSPATASSIFQRRVAFICVPSWVRSPFSEKRKAHPGHAAFTLIELLVAMAVLSLMILFLFAVFNQATQAWQASEKKVDAFREARAALYVMRRDIIGAYARTNVPMGFNVAGAGLPVSAQLQSAHSLFFVSSQSSDAQGSASLSSLCTVGYYVAWSTNEYKTDISSGTAVGASRSYNLFRYFKDGNDTYNNMANYWTALGGSTDLGSQLPLLFPSASSTPLSGDEVLARNVVDFTVTPYERATLPATIPTGNLMTARPGYLEVSLSVINYATAGNLADTSDTGANWSLSSAPPGMKALIEKNRQTFYNRIPLN